MIDALGAITADFDPGLLRWLIAFADAIGDQADAFATDLVALVRLALRVATDRLVDVVRGALP